LRHFQRLLKTVNLVKIDRIPSSIVLSSLLRSGNPSQNGGNPGRRVAEISKQHLFVAGGDPLLQIGHNGIIHLPLPKIANDNRKLTTCDNLILATPEQC
jgi:hypothetical protein